jgi:hypothetical protein
MSESKIPKKPPYVWTDEQRARVVVDATVVLQFVGNQRRGRHTVTRISYMGHGRERFPHAHLSFEKNPTPWEVLDPDSLVVPNEVLGIGGRPLPPGWKYLKVPLSEGRFVEAEIPPGFDAVDALEVERQLIELVQKRNEPKS